MMLAVLQLILQGLLVSIIGSCTLALMIFSFRYARASAAERVLIADAPERGNVIDLHQFRRTDKGLKLSVPAVTNPSRGGNA